MGGNVKNIYAENPREEGKKKRLMINNMHAEERFDYSLLQTRFFYLSVDYSPCGKSKEESRKKEKIK